ncbi:Hint domain-containing protein [Sinirhodobacter sp. WL0062]|uniref:Hint domain-containing protein n=1 Tax=Rhodobacter flavimaris TaxID=2907145 RepID=A0ABS8Z0N7_9RHOB|nr:Hint domain-containing protein [Sinirhodobacter sp. WL0062]MCE5974299.1 Hint domain-containing protein [Sinirhodobacter sp. WL0062]
MAEYEWYRTWVSEATGAARADSELIVVWFDTVAPSDPSGYDLIIIDVDGDGKISPDEWEDATGASGTKFRGDNTSDSLYNPEPSLGKSDGYLYTTYPIDAGDTGLLDDMVSDFVPVYPQTLDPNMPCFARGTWIDVPGGRRLVEDLRIGDEVLTAAGSVEEIRWIGSRRLTRELRERPHLRPIRISAGALGPGIPSEDLIVSPQHRVLVRSPIAQRMFEADQVLVPAKHLLGYPGVAIVEDLDEVEYFHILLDAHEILISNGAETESLYLGPQFLKTAGRAALREIREIFPDLEDEIRPFAHPVIGSRHGRKLAERHLRNRKPLTVPRG